MNKKTIKVIIAGVIIAVGGVIMVLCALGATGWNFNHTNNWQEDTRTFDAPISKIDLQVNCGQVILKRAETDKITITYQYDEIYQPSIGMNNGVLQIETPERRWYDVVQIGVWDAPDMLIEIPQNCEPQLDLKLNAGTLQVDSGRFAKSISVKINAGTLTLGDVVTETFEVKLNAGKFDAVKITCENAECKLNAGALDVAEIVCQTFDCKLNAGAANVSRLDSVSTSLRLSAGSVNVKMVGAQSDYNISVDKSAGSCNLSGHTNASATRTLTVNLSAGSANVRFFD